MAENKIQLPFNAHSVRDWEIVAQQELRNKNPWEVLTKHRRGVTTKPYYSAASAVAERVIKFPVATTWQNIPKVFVSDAKKANREALDRLMAGADGIWFEMQSPFAAAQLLENIELPFCSLFFSEKNDSIKNLASVAAFVEEKSAQYEINGAFLSNSSNILPFATPWKNFHTHGFVVEPKNNIVDEIVDSLLMGVDRVTALMNKNFSAAQAFRSLALSVSGDTDFFLMIAKIRALKNVWITLQSAYNLSEIIPAFIHVSSKKWVDENYQPHSNMLNQTMVAMAAAMAECDAITVEPEDAGNAMMSRIAQNVLPLLREESHLAVVQDPLAGSFYVDALTHTIAGEAWKKFQQQ